MSGEKRTSTEPDRWEDSVDGQLVTAPDPGRRHVIGYFRDSGDLVASLDELVDYLRAGGETTADRERLEVRLHHVRLPKLADAGVLEYDSRSHTVRYRYSDL